MDDGEVADGKLGEGAVREQPEVAEGHVGIGLVKEVEGAAAAAVIADDAVEEDEGSVFLALEGGGDGVGVDGVFGEADSLPGDDDDGDGVGGTGFAGGAAADGGEQGYFVAVGEAVGGGDVFAIDSNGDGGLDGGPGGGFFGDEAAAVVEEIADGGAAGEFERAGGFTEEIAEDAEDE